MVKRNNEKNKRIGFFGWSEEEKVDFMHLRSPRLSKVPSPEASQLEEKNQFSFDKVSFTHMMVEQMQQRVRRLRENDVMITETSDSQSLAAVVEYASRIVESEPKIMELNVMMIGGFEA